VTSAVPPVTRQLAEFLCESRWEDMPGRLRHEARRALLNWTGCALGGCRDAAIERSVAALAPFAGPPGATLIGRKERFDAPNAAFINAMSANILDYDDTHLSTVIHPSVPVAAALFSLIEQQKISGAQLLHAFILGVEAECRIGNAVSPGHYARGWHITGTCGVFGAAAAAGRILQLDARQMTWALGLAAAQSAGLVEMFGSMAKSLNIGIAAKNGLVAALLAKSGFTASETAIEGKFGFANVLAENPDYAAITGGLGETWELLHDAYKPYPCGVVLHPVLDACLALREQHALAAEEIARVTLRVHPLAVLRADRPDPQSGMEARLSLQHGAAVCLLQGAAGVRQFNDACAADPEVAALRRRVAVEKDEAVPVEAAFASLLTRDGRKLNAHIAHALGSRERPMSDAALEKKFHELAALGMPGLRSPQVIDLLWRADSLADLSELARLLAP
jgi:2-methylcitrate dehydratase PrpD